MFSLFAYKFCVYSQEQVVEYLYGIIIASLVSLLFFCLFSHNVTSCFVILVCFVSVQDFEEYPEHRTHFFYLLQAVNSHCFPAFLAIPPAQFKLVLDSIIWAFKHTMRNVADTGEKLPVTVLTDFICSDIVLPLMSAHVRHWSVLICQYCIRQKVVCVYLHRCYFVCACARRSADSLHVAAERGPGGGSSSELLPDILLRHTATHLLRSYRHVTHGR